MVRHPASPSTRYPAPAGRSSRFATATVRLFFQRYPGSDNAQSGIPHVPYTLRIDGQLITTGSTGTSGEILLRFDPTKTAVLEVFGTTYHITVRDDIEDARTVEGVQRRLNMLGYDAGDVDGRIGPRTDQSILEFQADHAIDPNGLRGRRTRTRLQAHAGA